ncbi:MAG TPA: redoxin domain-containing protein [Gemmataceae bacterium]|jgi:FtsP/CotA-like multicopper oxidase with cupredoxin domain/peroxiredoxin|nr:redoxin domain-containing protein [Gemmataceae bacterium]
MASSRFIRHFLAAFLFLALATDSREQDPPPKSETKPNVELNERAAAEEAMTRLRAKSVQFFKSTAVRPPVKAAAPKPLNVLMAPDAEKTLEATLPAPQRQSLARNTQAEYFEPDVIRSKNGELRVTLNVDYAHNHIGPDPVHLRAFNGKLVGPTLRCKPGDKLHITLKNLLPGERWLPHMMNTLNSFNTMNMHYHGLHVSPNGISDNILIQVGPHETQEYLLEIPKDHTTGAYWYHPHRHGSTAGDVASGLSGALIIEAHDGQPALDNIPEIKAAKERVLVLNQIPYVYKNTFGKPPDQVTFDLKEGVVEAKYANYIFGPGDWNTLGRYTTINGVQLPVIRMRPGQVERWRIVDSGQREMILLKMIPKPAADGKVSASLNFHEIAVDGLALGKMVESPSIELWPGYRSEVLVQAPPTRGEYLLIDDAVPASNTINGQNKHLNYVARIIVDGDPVTMKLPKSAEMTPLRLPSIPDKDITGKQEAKYGIIFVGQGANQTIAFTIDGKSFDMETARTLKLNDVDEWTISSINDVGPVTHPFHIHVNPFEVTSIMAPSADDPNKLVEQLTNGSVWRDTVKIPGNGYVKMRTRYTDFIGTFVQHCHILDHEDQGMMQLIDIVDPKDAPKVAKPLIKPNELTVAPELTLPDADGKRQSLADLRGKPVALFFFKGHGCLHCAQQVAAFTQHHDAFVKKGIQVIGVTSDSIEDLKQALEFSPCPFTLLADPKGIAFAKFGCVKADGLQHGTFSLDADHRVIWQTIGSSPFLRVKDLLDDAAQSAVPLNDKRRAVGKETRVFPSLEELNGDLDNRLRSSAVKK